jgi:N-acyl-D-aspartate/D-glutamate deacylase
MKPDIWINNGVVIDGSGRPGYRAEVMVKGDRIIDIGFFPEGEALKTIDATGLVIAPGFIDAHTHLDFLFPSPRHPEVLKSWAFQGVTTIVAGNCGWSPAPIHHEMENEVSRYWNFALPHDGLTYEWTSMGEYLDYLEDHGLAFNVGILTGHNLLRTNAMQGFHARPASAAEIGIMRKQLRDSLEAGSLGLSLGLYYCPGIFSHTDELMDLCSVLTEYDA